MQYNLIFSRMFSDSNHARYVLYLLKYYVIEKNLIIIFNNYYKHKNLKNIQNMIF